MYLYNVSDYVLVLLVLVGSFPHHFIWSAAPRTCIYSRLLPDVSSPREIPLFRKPTSIRLLEQKLQF
ncbi:hypothetical protein BDV36DRAFT_191376 [Aspergillus pseudocaelatus]|uniref:Secreted protein n=1 Tax=Aspergillus pseudocaelatus TaxID=1825620 RepID=A0ABQ6WIE5_9EURO|nr:hypothetical protein BDV36DRAFT_191376 [Aspergillus pseudocaelatus]